MMDPQREKTITEIVESERTYNECLRELQTLLTVYLREKKYAKKTAPSKELVEEISKTVDHLCNISKSMLANMTLRKSKDGDSIGYILKTYAPYFRSFHAFISKSESYLQAFQAFKCSEVWKQKVTSLLITPVQRLPRYRMLLIELTKHTPEDHRDYENLQNALRNVSECAQSVNSTISPPSPSYRKYEKLHSRKLSMLKVLRLDSLTSRDVDTSPDTPSSTELTDDEDPMWKTIAAYLSDLAVSCPKKRYECAKAFARSKYSYGCIHNKNKQRLRCLCIATAHASSAPAENAIWTLAARLFAEGPGSNGCDRRYEEVKRTIRDVFGESAINSRNKKTLKSIAVYLSFRDNSHMETRHPMWEFAETLFKDAPFSNGADGRYETVKAQVRMKWGKSAVNKTNKGILKALAVAAPYLKCARAA